MEIQSARVVQLWRELVAGPAQDFHVCPRPTACPVFTPTPDTIFFSTKTETRIEKMDLLHPNQEHTESWKTTVAAKKNSFEAYLLHPLHSFYLSPPPDTIFFPNEKINPEQEDLLHPKGKHNENHRRR
jgi:hypothetical protein